VIARPTAVLKLAAPIAAFLVLAAAAGASTDASTGVGVQFAPSRVVQGDVTRFSISVRPSTVRCTLTIRYRTGSRQPNLPSLPVIDGRVTWRFQVPVRAATGLATATARCGRAGSVSRRILIVGTLIPPRITVLRKGFSVRTNPYTGSSLSYGLILRNGSRNQDALNVSVLVNFVMADNNLLGTAATTVGMIPAGSQYAYGNEITFPAAAPIDRLEVVIQVGGRAAHTSSSPALSNVHFVPDLYDSSWLGSIEGEVVNANARLTMQTGRMSAVVFDKAGNVIGGGNSYGYATLPPATRQFFKISAGLRAIPFERAASAVVTAEATYLKS
jgi:hypothetical protein